MEKIKHTASRWLCIAVIAMLISMVGAWWIQTNGNKVTVKDLKWETSEGYAMSGLLFVPNGVNAENKAPAIVTSHGMYNNREMQDANFVELARRGYVVLAQDMPSHGNSDNVSDIGKITSGLYQSVKLLANLNYVDPERIGITGHSLGGMSCNAAVQLDNAAETPLIRAVMLNCADATYKDADGNYVNIYGTRDVGIMAAQYDEFFMRDVDENGNVTLPKDYVRNKNAQSFLYFGSDPSGQPLRSAETVYTQSVDGVECIRAIYNPGILHPWAHFSKQATAAVIGFFDETLGAPVSIDANSQVWQIKEAFNLLGLAGFFVFLAALAVRLLFVPFFGELRAAQPVQPAPVHGKGAVWFLVSAVLSGAFASIIYLPVMLNVGTFTSVSGGWAQSSPWGVSLWAALCGAFTLASMLVWYFVMGKKQGVSLTARGALLAPGKLAKTVLLALIVVAAGFGCVFFADYFFHTDFRIWVLAVKAFGPDKIFTSVFPYMLLFLCFYILSSISANCVNYHALGGHSALSTLIVILSTTSPAIVLLLVQYVPYLSGHEMAWPQGNMQVLWLFTMLVILPVSVLLSRAIYKASQNPYIGGVIMGVTVALISCSNTLTWAG